jgi:hypothetical protein
MAMLVLISIIISYDDSNVAAEIFIPSIRADDTGSDPSAQKYPAIAVDNNSGKIFVMYEDWRNDEDVWHTPTPGVDGVLDSDIYLCNSTNKGVSFGTCRRVNDDTGKAMQTFITTITTKMVIDENGIIHAVRTDWRNDADGMPLSSTGGIDDANNSDIYYANSSDGGLTFSVNKRVNDDSGKARQDHPAIAVDDNGIIHIVWRDGREVPKDYIYYANSTNGGITFNVNKRIDNFTGQVREVAPSIAVDDSNGNIYVVWEDRRGAPTAEDIYFAKSIDGGITFENVKRVNNDLGNAYQVSPFISAKNGFIGVVWADGSSGSNIYFANSTDGGDTFWNHKKVNSDDGSTGHEDSSIVLDENNKIFIAWADKRLGLRDIYFTTSTDNGTSFNIDQRVNDIVPGHQLHPSMVVDANGVVYIAWRHEIIGNVYDDIHFTRSNRPPQMAIPISPPNDSTLTDNSPTLIVNSITDLDDDNVYYNFTVSDQPDAESGMNFSSGWIDSTSWTTSALPDGRWYWHTYTSDMWNITAPNWVWNFTIDTMSPSIFNLQPPDATTTNDNTSIISVDYNDPSGINVSSVLFEVDGVNQTSNTTITPSGLNYAPIIPMADGIHLIHLEVEDSVGNLATATWSFTVDSTSPTITNLRPLHSSTISDNMPTIGADYSDSSGINVSSVMFEIDGSDMTSSAIVTQSGFTYIPQSELSSGLHMIVLEVEDILGNHATASWSFTIDDKPIIEVREPGRVPGQEHIRGDTVIVTWVAIDDNPLPSNPINITYKNSTSGWLAISLAEANDGTYAWDTSTVPCPGTYWLNLSVYDSYGQEVFDESNYSFNVSCPDTTPPIITNLRPPNGSSINDNTPVIGANFSDDSGINISSVLLRIDGEEVTTQALVSADGIEYVPTLALSDGSHTIYLEVKDIHGNKANITWTFDVKTQLKPPGDFLSEYWWILMIIIVVIVFLIILFLIWRRKRKREEEHAEVE